MKQITTFLLSLSMLFSLCACKKHEHTWVDATCTEPKTCSECGETEGELLGHDWQEATCTEPKTCTVCGETEGEALGHQWKEATVSAPKTCERCGETEGEPLDADVYDETGFLVSPHAFMSLYDRALGQIDGGGLDFGLKKDNEVISYDTSEDGKKVRICMENTWVEHSGFLSFEGNDNGLEPMKQVAVMYEAEHLLSNYSNYRSTILSFFAALPLAIDRDLKTLDEAMEVSDAIFAKASGGSYIHHVDTKTLPNLPATMEQNGVTYTLAVSDGIIYLYATVGTAPSM